MAEESAQVQGNPLIILGDKIVPQPHLIAFLENLRDENLSLSPERAIKYAVCHSSADVALTLRKYLDAVKMILLGPGLHGNSVTIARMLSQKAQIVMVVDPSINPLGSDPISYQKIQKNLEGLGVIHVSMKNATEEFFQPVVRDYVLAGITPGGDIEKMTPGERAQMIDKRLDAVNKFPSLPETQRKVAQLDDLDPPKKWAAAIDPDLPTRQVILKILNSARYSFRTRVASIDQAVALASARTIREIVTACQIRQLFHKTAEATIDQFWRHSLAVGFLAKLLSLPADPSRQTSQQKTEFGRFQLEREQTALLQKLRLWERFLLDPEKDDLFTAGLLHDIGKITMIMCLEDSLDLVMAIIEGEVQESQQQGKLWAHSLLEVERFLMKDMDHQVIGGRLAQKWDLEPDIQEVIAHHHDIQPHSPDLLKVVALADIGANALFPYPATETQHPFPQLFARLDKAVKKKSGMSFEKAVSEALGQEIFEELVEVLNNLSIPNALWELVDFKTFFELCYVLAPRIRSAAIAFLQQTGAR